MIYHGRLGTLLEGRLPLRVLIASLSGLLMLHPRVDAQPPRPLDSPLVVTLHRMRLAHPEIFQKITQPAPDMKTVSVLIGIWVQKDEISATSETEPRSSTSRVVIKETFGGAWLQMTDPDDPETTDYLGGDPATGDWVYLHFDRPGMMGTLRSQGGWAGDSLTLGGEITEYGLIVPERVVVTKYSSDHFEMRWEQRTGAGWQLISKSDLTRR